MREALLIVLFFTVTGSICGQELRIDSAARIFSDQFGTSETLESYSYIDSRNFNIRSTGYGYSQELLSDFLLTFRDSLITEIRFSSPQGADELMRYYYDAQRRKIEDIATTGADTISWSQYTYRETDTSDLRVEHRLKDWDGKEYYFVHYSESSSSGDHSFTDFSRISSDNDTLERERQWIWMRGDTVEKHTLHTFRGQMYFREHFDRWPVYTEVSGDTVYREYRYRHYDVDGSVSDDHITAAVAWDDGRGSAGEMTLDTLGYYQAEYDMFDEVADSTILDFYEGRGEAIGDYRNWRETLKYGGISHIGTRVEHYGSQDELLRVHLYSVDADYFFETNIYYFYDWINSDQNVIKKTVPTIIRRLADEKRYFDLSGRPVISDPIGPQWLIELEGRYSRKVLYIGQ